jgi:Mrp family chromosome partitioning ATPase
VADPAGVGGGRALVGAATEEGFVDLLRFARVVRRRWLLIVGLTIAGVLLGVLSTAFHKEATPTGIYYKSTETLTNHSAQNSGDSGFQSLNQVGLLVFNGDVPGLVAAKLGGSADDLVSKITVRSDDSLGILSITAISPRAAEADLLAKTFSDELVASLVADGVKTYDTTTKTLFAKRDQLKASEAELDGQIATATGTAADDLRAQRDATSDELRLTLTQIEQHSFDSPQPSPVDVLDAPQAIPISRAEYQGLLDQGLSGNHLTQVNPNGDVQGASAAAAGPDLSGPVPRGLLGGTLGLFLGIGIALLLDAVDRRIRSRDDLEVAFGAPVLAEIPAVSVPKDAPPMIVSAAAPYSRAAEGYRAVRSAVLFELALAEQHDQRDTGSSSPRAGIVVMVVSGVAAEGKTTTTANLAAAFAEAGSSVLAVNGDFRRPALHTQFGIADAPGAVVESGIAGVQVVTSVAVDRSAPPAQVVEAQRQLIQTTRRHYDIVLLDTAPLLSTNDAVDIAPLADLVLVVAKYGVTKQHHARRTAEVLERLRAPVGGVVFVATPASGDDSGYSYYYGAAAGGAATDTTAAPAAPRSTPPALVYLPETPSSTDDGNDDGPASNGNGNGRGTNGNGHGVNGNGHGSNGNGHGSAPATECDVVSVSWRAPLEWRSADR